MADLFSMICGWMISDEKKKTYFAFNVEKNVWVLEQFETSKQLQKHKIHNIQIYNYNTAKKEPKIIAQ